MKRASAIAALIATLAAAMILWHLQQPKHGMPAKGDADPPTVVSATAVEQTQWQSRVKAFGQLRASQGIDLSAEVAGIVEDVHFRSGEDVTRGTVLLRLRPNDDDAKLASLEASTNLWHANVERDTKQLQLQAVSRATLDADNASLWSFQAQIKAQKALMAQKVVRAPFSGRVGIRLVDPGQYLEAGKPITALQALDPIYVDFNVPQQQSNSVSPGQRVEVFVDTYADRAFEASVLASDSRVDPTSRMLSVRATLRNPDHVLLPGMFVVVWFGEGLPRTALTIPATAVSFTPYGDYVYVLSQKADHKGQFTAALRAANLGEHVGDRVEVLSGLKAGEQVVTAGQVKLRDGSVVELNNAIQPAAGTHPNPPEE
ncbi:MAG TPA: efflux RND transporter periplasmic adaptor subunit [Steroidobacteraceae bacterium]|nr:efflux RND transporter periplasmic adaptor subunit [Steroidobacteraceae bacterium]